MSLSSYFISPAFQCNKEPFFSPLRQNMVNSGTSFFVCRKGWVKRDHSRWLHLEDVGMPSNNFDHIGLHHTHLLATDQKRPAVLEIT